MLRWQRAGCSNGLLTGIQIKEFMYCAFDAAATHLYRSGLKEHMRNALNYGATPEEILEVLEIATLLSLHTVNASMPILAQLLQK